MENAASSPSLSPGGKKLVQARLPFKVVSPATPVLVTPPAARKRKLSPSNESVSKITKPCKENNVIQDLVVISDDESDTKIKHNPYLKIVDKAIKKKMQKKTPKKNKNKDKKCDLKEKSLDSISAPLKNEDDVMVIDETDDNNQCKLLDDKAKETEISNLNIEPEIALREEPVKISNKKGRIVTDHKSENPLELIDDNACDNYSALKPTGTFLSPKNCEQSDKNKVLKTSDTIDDDSVANIRLVYAEDTETDIEMKNIDELKVNSNDDVDTKSKEVEVVEDKTAENKFSSELQMNKNESVTPNSKKVKICETPKFKAISDDTMEQENNITPNRRSGRNKSQEKIGDETASTPNTSSHVDNVTPKRTKAKRSLETGQKSEPSSPAAPNLTPKQLQRKLESAKKKEEKEKDRLEKEKKRLQEKEERNRAKQEKEEQRKKEKEEREELKKKEKEEKEELKKKEKEEKDRQKEMERKEKEEKEEQKKREKEAKEEERRRKLEAIEEEKRQKEIEKQEQEIKKKKAAAAFVNFFVPKQKTEQSEIIQSKTSMLSSFTVKSDMRLAPTVRNRITEQQKSDLVNCIESQKASKHDLYIQCLKSKVLKPKSGQKTWPLDERDNDCMIVDPEDDLPPVAMGSGEMIIATTTVRERLRPKLLSFHENRRPPYWGTWRKKSSFVRPRRPFGTDAKLLDYEVDSDSEWEDEGDGESIAGSVGSVEEERDEYEVDNDVFVPHGYLSDEEGTMDGEEMMSLSPETQKAKLKNLEDEFESEMKKPTEKLKPRLYGMLWENTDGGKPENCIDALWAYFGKMAMIMVDPTALLQPAPETEDSEKKKVKRKKPDEGSPSTEKKKKPKIKKDTVEVKKSTELKKQHRINTFLTKFKT